MDIREAQQIIRDPRSSFAELCEAAITIVASPESTVHDLLACMDHSGLPRETARIELTNRYLTMQKTLKRSKVKPSKRTPVLEPVPIDI